MEVNEPKKRSSHHYRIQHQFLTRITDENKGRYSHLKWNSGKVIGKDMTVIHLNELRLLLDS